MTLIIYKLPTESNMKQVKTRWLAYSDADKTEVKLDETTEPPQNLYKFKTNLVIPSGTTYYFQAIRTVEILDENGDNVMVEDDDGNEIKLVKEISSDKLSKLNSESDIAAATEMYIPEMPELPILTSETIEDVLTVRATDLMPPELILDSVVWTVYDEYEKIVHVIEKTTEMNSFIVPRHITKTHNRITVTCIQCTEGLNTPHGSLMIDLQKKINIINLNKTTTSTRDLFLKFEMVSGDVNDLINIELYNTNNYSLVGSYEADKESNIVLIPRSDLGPDIDYRLDFRFIPDKQTSVLEVESFEFKTLPLFEKFIEDKTHKYQYDIRLYSSTTINKAELTYTEKRPDGRTLVIEKIDDSRLLTWMTTDNGRLQNIINLENTITIPDEAQVSSFNLYQDKVLLVIVETDKTTFNVVKDDFGSLSLTIISSKEITGTFDINSICFNATNSGIFGMTNDKFFRLGLIKTVFGEPEELPLRPDGVIEKTICIPYEGDILVLGGSSDYSYRFDTTKNKYRFFSVVPTQILNLELQSVLLLNGDGAIIPMNSTTREIVSFSHTKKGFIVHVPSETVSNAKGIIKSNGVIIIHNMDNLSGYLV